MSDIAISARGVSKTYNIGAAEQGYKTLREAIVEGVSSPFKRLRQLSGNAVPEQNIYHALSGVSFDLKKGEVLGLVGRNGAGKTTLMKILARITEASAGEIQIRGRVASLLEVGTGFHPELTGRENIYLNGAILGMTRAEITRKFDEIVAFAEVDRFLDTPVKRYSSGMYIRLAFAVASTLDPEILLVDEVLAVGDMAFQKKCLDRMQGLASGNRTIVFVSHNMSAVRTLCSRCLLLENGQVLAHGETPGVIQAYLDQNQSTNEFKPVSVASHRAAVVTARVDVKMDRAVPVVRVPLVIRSPESGRIAVWFRIKDSMGIPVAAAGVRESNANANVQLVAGDTPVMFEIPVPALANGTYTMSITLVLPLVKYLEDLEDCLSFTLERAPMHGSQLTLQQAWGFGSQELMMTQCGGSPVFNESEADTRSYGNSRE
jgi:lipopolysaccharide transport system ATP-binding protein